MLGWGLEEAFRNTSTPLFCPHDLIRQHAHVQVLQPSSWVLINSCPAVSLPSGEHSGEEGIYPLSFFFSPVQWMHLEDCTGLDISLWTTTADAAQLIGKREY